MAPPIASSEKRMREARSRNVHWVEVAEMIHELKKPKKGGPKLRLREDFWKRASEKTGYSRNILTRMETTLLRLRSIEGDNPEKIVEVLSLPAREPDALLGMLDSFPKAEIFTRIHNVDPAVAWRTLESMRVEQFSVARMQGILRELVAADGEGANHSLSKGDQESFIALEANLDQIYGGNAVKIFVGWYEFPFVSADAVAVEFSSNRRIENVDAFQVLQGIDRKTRKGYLGILSDTAFRVRFFRHVWLCLANAEDDSRIGFSKSLNRLIEAIDVLRLTEVGILTFGENSGLKILRRPQGQTAPILNEDTVEEIVRQGAPNFGAERDFLSTPSGVQTSAGRRLGGCQGRP